MLRVTIPPQFYRRPFTTAGAGSAGISKSVLRGREWRQVLRGVWVHRDLEDSRELRLAAAKLVLAAGSFICGPTAAWIHGIDVMHPHPDRLWIGCLPGRRVRARAGYIVKQVSVDPADLVELDGAVITSPLRTAFDCARWLPLVEGVVVADALSHERRFTPAQFSSYIAVHRGLRGVVTADRVIDLMDPKSESPMETRVRLLLVLAGLPRPEAQLEIYDVGEVFVARADLGYADQKVVVEYDGAWHWQQRRADDRRRDRIRDVGYHVIVVSSDDYFRFPSVVVAQVRNALDRAA